MAEKPPSNRKQAEEIWRRASEAVGSILSPDVYDRWIAHIHPLDLDGDTLILTVANDFYLTWLEEHYLPLIRDAVRTASGRELRILMQVDREAPPTRTSPETGGISGIIRRRRKVDLNPRYTFETFVVGPSNTFAHAAARAVAQNPARAYNPLFIYGGVGLGKTHLMQAIGHHAARHSRLRVRYVTCETFTNDYVAALQRKAVVEFRRKYRSTDILLVDDIHFLSGKEGMQEEFFHTFNALFESQKQIVMTSDRPASEIPSLEQRLVSRFEWGLVTELEPPDLETRVAILREKLEQFSLPSLDDRILFYIAEKIRCNIRRLEGALIRVASFARLTGHEITLPVVERLLRDTMEQETQQVPSVESIQKVVCDHFDLRLSDLRGRSRTQGVALARQLAMYLCRDLTPLSLPQIGEAFSRNHATVIHACRQIGSRRERDQSLNSTIELLRRRILNARQRQEP